MIDMFSKAKAARIVRELVDLFLDMEATTGSEVALCQSCIDWARHGNRVFLRQALEARLVALHVDSEQYTSALGIGELGSAGGECGGGGGGGEREREREGVSGRGFLFAVLRLVCLVVPSVAALERAEED